jgi:hypothetical protein
MRPLLNSTDAHASFIEAVRLHRIAGVKVSTTGKVRFEPGRSVNDVGSDYHMLPVFDLTQIEPRLDDSNFKTENGKPSITLLEMAAETMHFLGEQFGKGFLSVPYDEALYLQDNKGGTPIIWWVGMIRTPNGDGDGLNLIPFRWVRQDQVWLLETVVSVPLLHGQGTVGAPLSELDDDSTTYDAYAQFRHVGDVERRRSLLREHEHEVWLRVLVLLHTIQKLMGAEKGDMVVVEGTHEALRINARRERLGLPKVQPVVRIINLIPRTHWISGLPSEPTGRTVEPHHRRGSIVTNRFGTRFPRRATMVNNPARTREMANAHQPLSLPWYEVMNGAIDPFPDAQKPPRTNT